MYNEEEIKEGIDKSHLYLPKSNQKECPKKKRIMPEITILDNKFTFSNQQKDYSLNLLGSSEKTYRKRINFAKY